MPPPSENDSNSDSVQDVSGNSFNSDGVEGVSYDTEKDPVPQDMDPPESVNTSEIEVATQRDSDITDEQDSFETYSIPGGEFASSQDEDPDFEIESESTEIATDDREGRPRARAPNATGNGSSAPTPVLQPGTKSPAPRHNSASKRQRVLSPGGYQGGRVQDYQPNTLAKKYANTARSTSTAQATETEKTQKKDKIAENEQNEKTTNQNTVQSFEFGVPELTDARVFALEAKLAAQEAAHSKAQAAKDAAQSKALKEVLAVQDEMMLEQEALKRQVAALKKAATQQAAKTDRFESEVTESLTETNEETARIGSQLRKVLMSVLDPKLEGLTPEERAYWIRAIGLNEAELQKIHMVKCYKHQRFFPTWTIDRSVEPSSMRDSE